ncbi:hypothetical protein VE03_00621 [Pseudogymnoascus sp. 23342-1-I1]|nr:hypothetical protein VE03_00621 [Pseudogymnoascus sp. 23342-1-I1]
MESVNSFRYDSLDVLPWDVQNELLSPAYKVGNATLSAASDYSFDCRYFTGGVRDFSQFSIPISTCDDANTAPFLVTNAVNLKDTRSNTVRGTFNEKYADFEWSSALYGWFSTSSIRQNSGTRDEEASGIFTIKFKGSVDAENSHQMVLGPGSNISWVEDVKKTNVTTFCAAALNVTQDEGLGVSLHITTWVAATMVVGWSFVWANYL